MGKFIDLTGKKFNNWLVIEKDTERKGTAVYWKCQCDCGTIHSLRGNDLTSGHSKSCGCLNKVEKPTKSRGKDFTGQTFGYLTVLEKDLEKTTYGRTYWKCKCKCGNICSKRSDSFSAVEIPSCGCYKKERTSEFHSSKLEGQKFGKLFVLEKVEHNDLRSLWRCQCDCGNEVIYPSRYLLSIGVKSCGCDSKSYGELEIRSKLQELNLSFKEQYTFEDCISPKGRKLRFDFVVFKEEQPFLAVEFQGKQHYEAVEYFGGQEKFLLTQEYDDIKKEYCLKKGIVLECIPYTQLGKIDMRRIIEKNGWKEIV